MVKRGEDGKWRRDKRTKNDSEAACWQIRKGRGEGGRMGEVFGRR